jgi:hypothetical protein
MSEKAYQEFLALPVGALFTSADEWGERDAFIKVDDDRYRRTYDYITWNADGGGMVPGAAIGSAGGIRGGSGWSGIRVMDEVPRWISSAPPLTEEQCREHEAADWKRVHDYVKRTGEVPEMGFW